MADKDCIETKSSGVGMSEHIALGACSLPRLPRSLLPTLYLLLIKHCMCKHQNASLHTIVNSQLGTCQPTRAQQRNHHRQQPFNCPTHVIDSHCSHASRPIGANEKSHKAHAGLAIIYGPSPYVYPLHPTRLWYKLFAPSTRDIILGRTLGKETVFYASSYQALCKHKP